MTGARRRPTKETYRPPRDRKEIAVAVAAVLGVLLVTAVLIFVLRPDDDSPSSPSIPDTPVSISAIPNASVPTDASVPPDSVVPPESVVPPDTSAPTPPSSGP